MARSMQICLPSPASISLSATRDQAVALARGSGRFKQLHSPILMRSQLLQKPYRHTVGTFCNYTARGLASSLCNALEWLIDSIDSRSTLAGDNHHTENYPFLQGNFLPVASECPPQVCCMDEAFGQLPDFLEGAYIRNGPNQRYGSDGAAATAGGQHHLFDGDGMLHAVSIQGGKATYCCRYVRTSRFRQEDAAGRALFPKMFTNLIRKSFLATARMGLLVLRHVLGVVDLSQGIGLANTSLIFHHEKLLALGEDDLPHAVDIQSDGDLVNKGRYACLGDGRPSCSMTSHPKIDPVTGEMFVIIYNIFYAPFLAFFRVSQDGISSKQVPITLPEACMVHDFGLTRQYIIFPQTQIAYRILGMLQGKATIVCDRNRTQRFGVLPRYAQDDSALRWFNVPGCSCFHMVNSWEEDAGADHELVLVVPNLCQADDFLEGNFHNVDLTLTEVRLNLATGAATQSRICDDDHLNLEMGTMNNKFRGMKSRFVYMGVAAPLPRLSGVVKVDLAQRKVVARRNFDGDCFGSEPLFVPRSAEGSEEDDGCLVCLVHDEGNDTSRMLVLDARSPALEVMASVKLPRRVPYGFHGLFVPHHSLISSGDTRDF